MLRRVHQRASLTRPCAEYPQRFFQLFTPEAQAVSIAAAAERLGVKARRIYGAACLRCDAMRCDAIRRAERGARQTW